MLIRSQDKKSLTNFEQVTDLVIEEQENWFKIQAYYPFSISDIYPKMCLGAYSTEEKALKVLDIIHEQYERYSCRYGSDCSQYAVFQMPQDSEV